MRRTPAARSCMPHRMPRIMCDTVVMSIITTTQVKSHSSRTVVTISRKWTLWKSHTTSMTDMASGTV